MNLFPSSVNIGHYKVAIEFTDRLADDGGHALAGVYQTENHSIHLATDQRGSELAETFLHELIHAMYHIYGWGTSNKLREEAIANCLSFGMVQLFRDNPGLAGVLDDLSKGEH